MLFKSGDAIVNSKYRTIPTLIEKRLSAILCAFRKGHSTQHALFWFVEMVRRCIDRGGGGITAMVLIDLSKAYDSLPHDILFAKLNVYGVGIVSLNSYAVTSLIESRRSR